MANNEVVINRAGAPGQVKEGQVLVPSPEPSIVLDPINTRKGKYLGWDSITGQPLSLPGVGDDLLRSDLSSSAAGKGASLVNSESGENLQHALSRIDEGLVTTPRAAPYNLAINSQWEIWSGVLYSRRIKEDGSGDLGAATVSAYTTGGTSSSLTLVGDISAWRVGDLVKVGNVMGITCDPAIYSWPLRIQSKVGQVITIKTHLGQSVLTALSGGSPGIEPVNIGGAVSVGTGDCADHWKKPVALKAWRDDYASNLCPGALYALGVMKSTGSAEYVQQEVTTENDRINLYRGQTIAFGAMVRHRVKSGTGTWRVYIRTDGTGGTTTHSTSATSQAFSWKEVTVTVPTDATYVHYGVEFLGAGADVYYVCNPVQAVGNYIGANNYAKPRETLLPVVKVEPTTWINATLNFPATATIGTLYAFYADFHAASGGAIAKSVRIAEGNIEGYNSNTPVAAGIDPKRLVGWCDKGGDPLRLNGEGFMAQVVHYGLTGSVGAGYTLNEEPDKSYSGLALLMNNGEAYCYSGVASDTWSNVSVDLGRFTLA